ncbi:hypothetical protein [Aromatoleum petrolei]|nr:hypothetical protein [Aromatoleum petrolei]
MTLDTPKPSALATALRRTVALLAIAGMAFLLASGCSAPDASDKRSAKEYQLLWPEPPNEARFEYEAQLRSEANIRPETDDGRTRKILTGKGSVSEDLAYRKPAALAARGGRIYVADPPTGSVVVFDAARQRMFRMGIREPNNVIKPISIAIDNKNFVYVLDGKLRRVMVYDSLGLFQFAVGDPKALTQPSGVAVSDDGKKIFIVDRGSIDADDHKVIAYSPDNLELFRIGPRGSAPGALNIPLAAITTRDGRLAVLDSGNFRVQIFDLNGRYQSHFGSVGNGYGQFSRPRSIASDQDGNLYVSDASFNNVQIFTPTGELLMWIGGPGMENYPGKFGLIAAIAADETGRLYIADHYHLKVEVYKRADGTPGGKPSGMPSAQ